MSKAAKPNAVSEKKAESAAADGKSAEPKYQLLCLCSETQFEKWDKFVAKSPQANPFAARVWLDAARALIQAKLDLWVVTKGDEWLAGVVLYYREKYKRKIILHAPLAAYSSVLYSPAIRNSTYPSKVTSDHIAVTKVLLDQLKGKYAFLQMQLLPDIEDVRPWIWNEWLVAPKYTYVLDVTSELPISYAVRKHIKKCAEAKFQVSWDWNLDEFWRLYQFTMDRQEFALGIDWLAFKELATKLHAAGLAWMGTARTPEGDGMASRIVVAIPNTRTVFDWVAGGDPKFMSSGVNPWLMTMIAQEIKTRGHTRWDLCGADLESVARFKSELGGALTHYFLAEMPLTAWERSYQVMYNMRSKIRNLGR